MSQVAALVGLLMLPLLAAIPGCSGCNVSGQQPLEYTEGIVSADGTMYESTQPGAEMLHFPPGRVYHLAHGLGTDHLEISPYVSFVKQLVPEGDGSDPFAPNHISAAAGNQAVIEGWNPDFIRIRNDTCAEFYLYVVARTSTSYSSAGASSN